MNRIETVLPNAIEFAAHITESCRLMKAILEEPTNFKKPQKLHELIIQLNHQEEECDKLYLKATRNIRDYSSDVLTIISWRVIFDKLEAFAHACEHVGDCIETIVMKNT